MTNGTFAADVIRVPHDHNIWIQSFQGMLRPRRGHIHGLGNLGNTRMVGRANAELGQHSLPYTQQCTL